MLRIFSFLFHLVFATSFCLNGQSYSWTGATGNNNFFDEQNWLDTLTYEIPSQGSINPGKKINLNLTLTCNAEANGTIQLDEGVLKIKNGTLEATSISGGNITLDINGYLNLSDSIPLLNETEINFIASPSWLRTSLVPPTDILNNHLSKILVKKQASVYLKNIRIDNYYEEGSVIRCMDSSAIVMIIYSKESLQGIKSEIKTNFIFRSEQVLNSIDIDIKSFLLKKGFMATLSVNPEGTGKSKVFIASDADLRVNELPNLLSEGISFIRVIPWNWVSKKGVGGNFKNLNNSWFYLWNNTGNSSITNEYTPMSWGIGGTKNDDIEAYKSINKSTHIMGFNEPDHCDSQSGQYGELCKPDTAIKNYKNLMKAGLRMVSPACREEQWNKWLDTFNILAQENNVRIDVIAVHWYDWGINPKNSPNANSSLIFNRFKNYLARVYDWYKLPIWITEFNANLNRTTTVNLEFMKLALPYLDSLDYVERYAWFQPNSDVADFYDSNETLTSVGLFYKNKKSSPSIPKKVFGSDNNLERSNENIEYSFECKPFKFENNLKIINTKKSSSCIVYPSPVRNTLKITCAETVQKIEIYTSDGKSNKIVYNINSVDITELRGGIYFIKINDYTLQSFLKI
ncbi:MAG: hypothetical protein CMD18_05620 [Flavobacteriales bacterium]|nr:hypothetical protein [Flavobacteriales bacterium]